MYVQLSLLEDEFNISCMESPVSDNIAVIPNFEQCAELIVKHCPRGGRGNQCSGREATEHRTQRKPSILSRGLST